MELDGKENGLSRSATSAEVQPPLNEHRSLLYRADAPRFNFVQKYFVKNRKPMSSEVTTRRHSKK